MRVREIMSRPVEAVSPFLTVADAAALMHKRGVHHLIVMQSGETLGVLSSADLRHADARSSGRIRVQEIMNKHVVALDQNETVRRAANLMQHSNAGCLAVTRAGRLTGIVTVSDLLRLLGKGGERRATPERPALHYRVPHKKQRSGSRW